MRLGIDAVNIRAGGGVTHLVELLSAGDPREHGISNVTVWAGTQTLDKLPNVEWLSKAHAPQCDGNVLVRELWRRNGLTAEAKKKCDLLFVPGGNYAGDFFPFVTMSRNLLPFASREKKRYGLSVARFRLEALGVSQARTFRRAQGVIFLTHAARDLVLEEIGTLRTSTSVIPHGVSPRFRPNPDRHADPHPATPFRWLYVSNISLYKHQWHVADAVSRLHDEGYPVELHLTGLANPDALRRLNDTMNRVNHDSQIVHYHGAVSRDAIERLYNSANGFVFASTCETISNILLESMSAGLPIACAEHAVLREVLGESGVYFQAEDPSQIYVALKTMMDSQTLRQTCADMAVERAKMFTWERCAQATYQFLRDTYAKHQ